MSAIVVRALCLAVFVSAFVTALTAVSLGDTRLLFAQINQVLLGVVLWVSLPSGSEWFQPPRFGTRGLRLALYWATLMASLVASLGWPFFSTRESPGSTGFFLLTLVLLSPFMYAERKRVAP